MHHPARVHPPVVTLRLFARMTQNVRAWERARCVRELRLMAAACTSPTGAQAFLAAADVVELAAPEAR